jgi:hypothetical protein
VPRDGSTRRKLLRDAEARYGKDRSVVVYGFADGWTIRRMATRADECREGLLMAHCLDTEENAPTGVDDPWGAEVGNLFSLRDADDFPHVTFGFLGAYADEPGWLGAAAGNGDSRPVKPAYVERLLRWVQSLPYPVHVRREAFDGPPRTATTEWNEEVQELAWLTGQRQLWLELEAMHVVSRPAGW